MADLRSYFEQLRKDLHLEPVAAEEVLRELETHAEDRLEDLRRAGAGEEEISRVLRRDFGRPQVLARLLREAHSRASWQEALLAGAPFLLAALLFTTHRWHSALALAAFAAAAVLVTLHAWWRGKPSWFYSWAGMSLTILPVCAYLAFLILCASAGRLAEGTKNPLILLGFSGAVVYYPLSVLVLLWCTVVVVRRDWLLASVMLSPLPPVAAWLAAVHGAGGLLTPVWSETTGYDGTLAAAFVGMAIAAAMIIRTQSHALRLGTLVGSVLVIAAAASQGRDASALLSAIMGRGVPILCFLLVPALLDGLVNGGLIQMTSHSPGHGDSR